MQKQEPGVWIFVDNSNLWREVSAHVKKGEEFDFDHRLDIGNLVSSTVGKRNLQGVFIYGSRPPKADTIWKMSEAKIKVEQVSTQMIADVTEIAFSTPMNDRSTILVITGRTELHTVNTCVEKVITSKGWSMELCLWKDTSKRIKYNDRSTVKFQNLEDHVLDPKVSCKSIGKLIMFYNNNYLIQ